MRRRVRSGLSGIRSAVARLSTIWIIVLALLGFTITALAANLAAEAPGVYWSSSRVTILPPQSEANPNMFQISLRSLAMTAGTVAHMVSDDPDSPRAVEPEIPLPSLGVRSGWSVQQPDRGGQWSHQFSDPYLTIQAVDPDPRRVKVMMAGLEGRVRNTLVEVQDDAKVAPVNRFTTATSPPTTTLYYTRGSKWRAFFGTFLLGAGITTLVVSGVIRASRNRVGSGS